MVIRIFYAVCGLGVLFFGAFFLQCCRSASRKTRLVIRELSISDTAETARMFVRWEKEMAEFMARQGRSTTLLFLVAAGSLPLLSANIFATRPSSTLALPQQRALHLLERRSRANPNLCKKN